MSDKFILTLIALLPLAATFALFASRKDYVEHKRKLRRHVMYDHSDRKN